ncbi:MAG: ABC transporter ATP-binding protein [Alphaproteobacteria bacterium]
MEIALELQDIDHAYATPVGPLHILKGVSLSLARGEVVGLIAPSGAGKSTLLHIAGLLERPASGSVILNQRNCSKLNDKARTLARRREIGFVYQFHHLLPEFSALENAAMPQIIAGVDKAAAAARAQELLDKLGVGARATHRPAEMSGGEQQRVAIARAFANRPAVLLADEPTGNLDSETADKVFDTMVAAARTEGLAALIVTHNPALAARMDRVLRLDKGTVVPG